MTIGNTIALTRWTFVSKVMSLLFNMLSMFFIVSILRNKCLLISWLRSSTAVIFGAQENKICHCLHFFPIYLLWIDGTRFHDLSCLNVVLRPPFHSSFSPFIKRVFSSSSLSAIRVLPSVYLNLLIFLWAVLIPAWHSSSLAFCLIYCAYKLNKQGDNIQPWQTHFSILNQSFFYSMSSFNCCFLTCIQISQEIGKVVLRIKPSL